MDEVLGFDDVLLVPQYSDIRSRDEIDLSITLPGEIKLKYPIISAPMDTVTSRWMAYALGG